MLWPRAVALSLVLVAVSSEPGSAAPPFMFSSAAGGSFTERAQAGPRGTIDPNRHCQTVRACRFTRGGIFRGCISAYSCRTCGFVPAPCTISGRERICQRLRCHWGV
jgi:hypothetical protein